MSPAEPAAPLVVLARLLDDHPAARISAVSADGAPADVPDDLELGPGHEVHATSGIVGYLAEDRTAIIAAFDQAQRTGAGRARARMEEAPDIALDVHIVDTSTTLGVLIAVTVVADQSTATPLVLRQGTAAAPRLARIRKSKTATIVGIDDAVTVLLGWTSEEMVGRRSLEFIHPEDQPLAIESWFTLWSGSERSTAVRLRYQAKSGEWVWFETSHLDLTENDVEPHVLAEMVDISAEMAAREALEASERLLRQLTQTLPLGVFQTDLSGRLVYSNSRLYEITGTVVTDAAPGPDPLTAVLAEERPLVLAAFGACLDDRREHTVEVRFQLPGDGRLHHCSITVRPLVDEGSRVTGLVGCVSDTTEHVMMRQQLQRQATVDDLTGCLNRAATLAALDALLRRTAATVPDVQGIAAVFIDLDEFKVVNDKLGHAAGDVLLRTAAEALRALGAAGADLVVGRMGGDEFLVARSEISEQQAYELGRRVAGALDVAVPIAGSTATLRASVGVAWTDRRDVVADDLIAEADQRMYEAKRAARRLPVPRVYDDRVGDTAPLATPRS